MQADEDFIDWHTYQERKVFLTQLDLEIDEERYGDWEVANCCGGRMWDCAHYGHAMSLKDYYKKWVDVEV